MEICKRVFVIVLISHLSFLLTPAVVHAEEYSGEPVPTSYDLAYPGLLPDHPFYFLKVARDTITGFFKGKPLDKASYALLQSDKHLAASEVLVTQKQRPDLSFETLDQSHDYLEEAINQTVSAKKEGMDIHEMCDKLKEASHVHARVLNNVKESLEEKDSKKYAEEKKRTDALIQTAAAIKP